MTAPIPTGRRHGLQGRPGIVLAITCAAQFMGVLDVTIVNVALPAMQDDLGLSPAGLQWVVNGYTLTFAGFLLLGGRAADLLGLKRVFLAGLVLFTVASLAGGLAQEPWQLVGARAVQGLGGAILTPATLTMVITTYPQPAARAKALGIWSAVAGAGGALGGVIGGVLTGLLSWRWVLIVNVPIGVLLLVAGLLVLHGREQRAPGRLDLAGSATVTLGTGSLVGAIVSVEQHGWGSPLPIGLLVAAVLLLVAFVKIERRAPDPLVPLRIFRVRSLSLANGLSLLTSGVLPATFFFMSLFLQQVQGLDPLPAGLALLPPAIGIASGSVLASRLHGRVPDRALLLGGSVLSASMLVWLAQLEPGTSYPGGILAPLFLAMVGFGLVGLPLTMAATADVGPDQHGLASGLLNTGRQVGGAIGLALLVAIAASVARPDSPTSGFAVAWWVGAGIVLVGGVASLALPQSTRMAEVAPEAVRG